MNRFGSKILAISAAVVLAISLGGSVAASASTPPPQLPGTFQSQEPVRVLDTRFGNGAPKAPVAANGTVALQLAGRGGVPTTGVAAVVLNVTVTGPAAPGFVTVYPAGTAQPTASNLNFSAGQTIPNLVTVKMGAGGVVNLSNNSPGSAHLLADVAGYYLAGTPTVPGAFVSLDPARVLDTRTGNGAPMATVAASGTVGLQVTGRGGVPASGVSAVVVNVTTTASRAGGFVTVYPAGTAQPTASNLNFSADQTIANLVTVKVGADGKINLTNNSAGTSHLIADVAGYYLAGTATQPGAFVSLDPARFLDTRVGNGAPQVPLEPSGTIELQITNRNGVPTPAVAAVVLNVTATNPAASGFVTVYPSGDSQPTASNLNFTPGQTIPNLATVKIGGNGRIDLTNNSAGTVDLIADVAGYFIASPVILAEVWPTGWMFDSCGTEWDGLLLRVTPGLTFSPWAPTISFEGSDYYEYLPNWSGEVVVSTFANPGYELVTGGDWVATSDNSATGTFYFSGDSCISQRSASPEQPAEPIGLGG